MMRTCISPFLQYQRKSADGILINAIDTHTIIDNICDPCDDGNGLDMCSIGCIDFEYFNRVSAYYPSLTDSTYRTNFNDCPSFWRSHKVKIEPSNLTSIGWFQFIQVYSATIGAACALSAVSMLLFRFVQNLKCFKEETKFNYHGGSSSWWSKLTVALEKCRGTTEGSFERTSSITREISIYESDNAIFNLVKLFALYFLSNAPDVLTTLRKDIGQKWHHKKFDKNINVFSEQADNGNTV